MMFEAGNCLAASSWKRPGPSVLNAMLQQGAAAAVISYAPCVEVADESALRIMQHLPMLKLRFDQVWFGLVYFTSYPNDNDFKDGRSQI